MSVTVDKAISNVRGKLRSTYKANLNVLGADVDFDDATIMATYPISSQPVYQGTTLSIGTEDLIVVQPPTGLSIPVLRGQNGTDPQAHVAGDVMHLGQRYSSGAILEEMLAEGRTWTPWLYKREVGEAAFAAGILGADLGLFVNVDIISILDIWLPGDASSTSAFHRPITGYEFIPVGPPALCPEGTAALILGSALGSARTLHLEYAAPINFDNISIDTDLQQDLGLLPVMVEVLVLGAAKRLLVEGPRTDQTTQGQPRDAQDVPPGHITAVRRDFEDQYKERRDQAIQALGRHGGR